MIKQAKAYAKVISQMFFLCQISGKLKPVKRGARHLSLAVRLQNPNDLDKAIKMAENIALAAGSKNVLAQRDNGLVVYQFELSEDYWQFYTRQDLSDTTGIGLAEQKKIVSFQFEQSAPHALFAGTTGSGKTEAIKSTLVSLMSVYEPNELELVVCDPFFKFDDFDNEVHLALPVARNADEMQLALSHCYNELIRRQRQNIKDASILCLVYDEVTESLFTSKDFEMLKTLSKTGRNFGIHLIVGTQKPNEKDLPGIVGMLLNRFVGLVANAQTSAQLTGHSGLQAHKLTGQGDFLHVVGGLQSERFQVAQATQSDFDKLERGEIKPVVVKEPELVLLPEKSAGRPSLEVQSDILAYYWLYGPDNISQSQAADLGITRTGHKLHKDFCWQFGKKCLELRRLKNV